MGRIEEILKDFEKLGWHVIKDRYVDFMLKKIEKEPSMFGEIEHHCYIGINKEKHTYSVTEHCFTTQGYELSMKEHKLLHELFICYGWL